jgi:hypothetical protein
MVRYILLPPSPDGLWRTGALRARKTLTTNGLYLYFNTLLVIELAFVIAQEEFLDSSDAA